MGSATIKDVAQAAGVSICAVSRVLNHHPLGDKMRPETRERIMAAARELAYNPSSVGRNFRLRRSFVIAMVVDEIAADIWLAMTRAISQELGEQYQLMICNTGNDPQRELRLLDNLSSRGVDAVILLPAASDGAYLERLSQFDFPIVMLEAIEDRRFCYASGDDVMGGVSLAERLMADGHRRVIYLDSVTPNRLGVHQRREAFSAACKRLGMEVTVLVADERDEFDLGQVLPLLPHVTVVVGADDRLAAKLQRQLCARGIYAPGDYSLVGWNDSPIAGYCQPPLASMVVPFGAIGRHAARLALQLIDGDGKSPKEHVLVPMSFMPRESYRGLR